MNGSLVEKNYPRENPRENFFRLHFFGYLMPPSCATSPPRGDGAQCDMTD